MIIIFSVCMGSGIARDATVVLLIFWLRLC